MAKNWTALVLFTMIDKREEKLILNIGQWSPTKDGASDPTAHPKSMSTEAKLNILKK